MNETEQAYQRLFMSDQLQDFAFEPLMESFTDDTGKKRKIWMMNGKYMQGNVLNGNQRVYLTEGITKGVQRWQSAIASGCAWGELNHPKVMEVNPERTVLLVKSLMMEGDDAIGTGRIMTTNNKRGQLVVGLLEDGAKLGVSSRATGLVKYGFWEGKRVPMVHDTFINAVDIVHNPSGPNCYPDFAAEFLTESVNLDWVVDLGVLEPGAADLFETTIQTATVAETIAISNNVLDGMLTGRAHAWDNVLATLFN